MASLRNVIIKLFSNFLNFFDMIDKKMLEKFLAFMVGNDVSTDILLDYKNSISVGDFRFENGVHFPVLIPGLKANGVYIDKEYIIDGGCERDGETTLTRARRFCENRGYILPSYEARNNMLSFQEKLITPLQSLGFPLLYHSSYWKDNAYWAEGDASHEGEVKTDVNSNGNYVDIPPDTIRKHVRGCKRVKANLLFEVQYTTSPYGYILGQMMLPKISYRSYIDGLGICYPTAGWYLEKNGNFSEETEYDCEKGICVTPNLCLDLNMLGAPMTAEEVGAYCAFYDLKTPTEEQLLLMQKYAPQINEALNRIDMADMHIPETDIKKKCWSQESLYQAANKAEASDVTRWHLPILELEKVPEIYVLLAELGVGMNVD